MIDRHATQFIAQHDTNTHEKFGLESLFFKKSGLITFKTQFKYLHVEFINFLYIKNA